MSPLYAKIANVKYEPAHCSQSQWCS